MFRHILFLSALLLMMVGLQAQTTIYFPDVVGDGPAIILADTEPAPTGYTAAENQECAQQVVDADPFCTETSWDGLCQTNYDLCANPTCEDGVQNGEETGVDCGGPDCPICPTCDDGVQNGDETGVDCGGAECAPCTDCPGDFAVYLPDVLGDGPALLVCDGEPAPDGYTAAADQDCALEIVIGDPFCLETSWDGVCQDAYDMCVTGPTCEDGVQNGEETAIDCGGPDCPACPTCDDGVLNGNETGIDCGGPDCVPCEECPGASSIYLPDLAGAGPALIVCEGDPAPDGYTEAENQDCALEVVTNDPFCLETSWDGVCQGAYDLCANPTCDDGVQNGEETGVDCGGPECPICPTCDDGVLNGNETGIDCGGPDCDPCEECPGASSIYLPDVAGDGPALIVCEGDPAPDGYTEAENQDCALEVVTNDPFCLETSWDGVCQTAYDLCANPTCDDGVQNGEETGVDCGGPECPICPTCDDGVQNGNETGVDCGGGECLPCIECPGAYEVYVPDVIGEGPAIIVCEGEIAPIGYSAAENQECALQVVTEDPFCLETSWDGVCQTAYEVCLSLASGLDESVDSEFTVTLVNNAELMISHPRNVDFRVEILDITGRSIISQRISSGSRMDVSSLGTNLYFLVIYHDGQIEHVQRLVLNR